ncbi:MAG: sucrose-phosphate phosphatase [Xenococcus sp. MO_188.B8]|nr:sucrose-phosphate phosphatase [Xenococcus sp. MO_188.B8]
MKPFLFVTDLDDTLLGDDSALKALNRKLKQHRQQSQTKIVYTTGRSFGSYQILAKAKSLLRPDALLTSVGTEIYFNAEPAELDPEWSAILAQGWHREQILAIANAFPQLQLQPPSEQNPFKISYYLCDPIAETIIAQLKTALAEKGFQVKFSYHAGQDLDLLPPNVDKGLAVKLLRSKWQLATSRTVTCGDSESDIDLFSGEENGIIVGNAKPELLQWYQENQRQSLYHAQKAFAAGILEGLQHFAFLPKC